VGGDDRADGGGARRAAQLAGLRTRRQGPRQGPQDARVYLFSESGEHLYVGRTGRTERSVKAGKQSASGFRARLAGHSAPGAGLSSASFALRLAMGMAANERLDVPANAAIA
jgi:hypothetical protein